MAVATGTAILSAAAITAGVSGYSAYTSGQAAEDATSSSASIAARQQALAEEQWDRYLETYAPLEDQLVASVQQSTPLEEQTSFKNMMAGIDGQFGDASANISRTMGGRYESGSGLEQAAQTSNEHNRIKTRASAYADAAAADEESKFNKMLAVASLGSGVSSSASSNLSSASNTYSDIANTYSNAAASGWNSVGNTVSNATQLYMLNKMMGGGSGSSYSVPSGWGSYNSGNGFQSAWAN